jgi:predicted ATP-dependent endonuclease of OLD family
MTLELIDDKGDLRIVQLQAENFMKLKAVEITPHGDTVIISGKNAAGKSAVLNAIVFALGGKKALNKIPDPVRHGEKSTKVTIDLGDYSVTRRWKDGKSQLEITSNDNRKIKYGSPAGMLDSIVGELSFDPLEFANQSEKDQIKTLLELVKLPIDLYALDDDRKVMYESRTLVNRAVKHLDGKVAGFPAVDAPNTEINTSDIMSAMELATKTISDNKDVRDDYSKKLDAKSELSTSIQVLESELLRQQDRLSNVEFDIDRFKRQVEFLIDPDLTVFKDQLQNAEQINANVRSMQQRNQIIAELNAEKENSEELTAKINEIDDLKERTIREAEMPIEGLGQNKISVAIGMAMNPKLKVLLIRDGSALDSNSMNDISEMVKEKGYQAWIEVVRDDQTLGVCIEDGSVVAVNE